jgi:hypothetical protein
LAAPGPVSNSHGAKLRTSMSSIVTLVIYLSAAEAADPASAALAQSAREVLGDQARVALRVAEAGVSVEALANAEPGADAVAEIAWSDSGHRQVSVHCYLAKTHQIVEREITFDEDARPRDRERMLGFVLASMLPPETEAPPEKAEPPAAESVPKDATPSAGSKLGPMQSRFVGMAEVVGLASAGIGGSASGVGAEVGGRWLFARSLSLRISGGLRRGDIPEASSISEVEFLGLGLAFEAPVSMGSHLALGGRVSGLALRHEVDHLSSDDRVPDRKSRLLPGTNAMFEASWHFSSSAAFVAGVGSELAFGHTDVLVGGKEVTEIPPLRALAELGIQAKF